MQCVQLWECLIFSDLLPQHFYPSGFSPTQWNLCTKRFLISYCLRRIRTSFKFREKGKWGLCWVFVCLLWGGVWLYVTVSACSPALRSALFYGQTGQPALWQTLRYFSPWPLPAVCFVSHWRSSALAKTDCRIGVFAGHTHTYLWVWNYFYSGCFLVAVQTDCCVALWRKPYFTWNRRPCPLSPVSPKVSISNMNCCFCTCSS